MASLPRAPYALIHRDAIQSQTTPHVDNCPGYMGNIARTVE